MRVKLAKWGNSFAIRLAKPFLKELNIDSDEEVNVSVVEDKIIIKKVLQKYDLGGLIDKIDSDNMHSEVSIGTVTGKELW